MYGIRREATCGSPDFPPAKPDYRALERDALSLIRSDVNCKECACKRLPTAFTDTQPASSWPGDLRVRVALVRDGLCSDQRPNCSRWLSARRECQGLSLDLWSVPGRWALQCYSQRLRSRAWTSLPMTDKRSLIALASLSSLRFRSWPLMVFWLQGLSSAFGSWGDP